MNIAKMVSTFFFMKLPLIQIYSYIILFELGICVDLLDSSIPIRESLRSETEFDTNIDAPIRIHKYNLDNYLDSDYDDLDSEEVKHISN